MDLSTSARTSQINSLLADLQSASCSKDPAVLLLELKNLAKHPSGSAVLAAPHNLRLLLSLATQKYSDNLDAKCEALRCIANCLLLVERSRDTLVDNTEVVVVGEEVNGGQICLAELEKSTNHQSSFVLARILFLSTFGQSPFLQDAVDKNEAVRIISTKLDELTPAVVAGEPGAKEAMTDLLKFTFNLLMHYPKMAGEPQDAEAADLSPEEKKVIGDYWSDKLDGILPALLRAFKQLPPTALVSSASTGRYTSDDSSDAAGDEPKAPTPIVPAPLDSPLTHIIHSLITIPINSGLKSTWFATTSSQSVSRTSSEGRNKKGKSKQDNKGKGKSETTPERSSTSGSRPSINIPAASSSDSRPASPLPSAGRKSPSTLDRALSMLSKTRRSLSRSPTPGRHSDSGPETDTKEESLSHGVDVLARAFSLLSGTMELYLPGAVDPDDVSVRDRLKSLATPPPPGTPLGPEAASLDDPVSPLVLLLSRLCLADSTCRRRLRSWLVPKDLDRSEPLETHASLLGRLLRLLGCVYHSRTKDAAGELLYAMCNSDASTLSALVGYGNVAGFLFNKGVMSAPAAPDGSENISELPDPSTINPITGTTQQPKDTKVMDEMTEEEKEQEMEKLFVVFDRLEKLGAIKPESNPVREAIKKGMSS